MTIRHITSIIWILALIVSSWADTNLQLPALDYDDLGGKLGFFGQFDAVSRYTSDDSADELTSSQTQSNGSTNVYLKNKNGDYKRAVILNGIVYQMQNLQDSSAIIVGNFTQANNKKVTSPIIYDANKDNVSPLLSGSSKRDDSVSKEINGEVKTVLVDGDLVYLGGDFEFNGTYGTAIYNKTSKKTTSLPFKGFGRNSSVNAIAKIFDDDKNNQGSIVFGGKFHTLGLKELLYHRSNKTRHHQKNSTNSSLILAEQQISLKHGTFTTVNGDQQDASSIICPANNDQWSLNPGQGGEWAVELPSEAKGVVPTKARLTIPEGNDGVKLFRIYSYPNNGIMNLTYIDPQTNQLAHCDAWCPLLTVSNLTDATNHNKQDHEDILDSSTSVNSDGSFAKYYDPTTKTKTLGYGKTYQEFAFVDNIAVDKVGVTIVAWYGSKGVLSGFELYLNSVTVYGNNSLNDPNCDLDDEKASYAELSGDFQSALSLNGNVQSDYLVSTDTMAEVTFYPNISYSGNYSIIMTTPGCAQDNSCASRSIVNVTVLDQDDDILSSKLIYQNNDYDKFDYLFDGHLKGSVSGDGENKIKLSYYGSIGNTNDNSIVVDKVIADIVSLDKYYSNHTNHTNSTSDKYHTSKLKLNGLFEYSLSNFSDFNERNIINLTGKKKHISFKNTYVGNSTLNYISAMLSNDSIVEKLNYQSQSQVKQLLILGQLNSDSKYLNVSNDNVIQVNVKGFNETANSTQVTNIEKRDSGSSDPFSSVKFNDSITDIFDFGADNVVVGKFQISDPDGSDLLRDFSNHNDSVDYINNFALLSDGKWYGFGNDFIDEDFKSFTNVTIQGTEYFVFAADSTYMTWDRDHSRWQTSSGPKVNVTSAVNVANKQQILAGSGLSVMDLYSVDQAFINTKGDLKSFDFNVTNDQSYIQRAFYVNDSLTVAVGNFSTLTVKNVGLIDNSSKDGKMKPLNGKLTWGSNTTITSLHVDSRGRYLFLGTNGPVTLRDSTNVTGVLIYDLKNNQFPSFQPAELSTSSKDGLKVNSIVLDDKTSQLLVGGNFEAAGSLGCQSVCVYDLKNARWNDPQKNNDLSGTVTDVNFISKTEVLLSGALKFKGKHVHFVTYSFSDSSFTGEDSLNKLDSKRNVKRFILSTSNQGISGGIIAQGDDFVAVHNDNWVDIDKGIVFDTGSTIHDMELLPLSKKNKKNNGKQISNNKALVLAGNFTLLDYGQTNVALYNGSTWQPFVFTSLTNNEIGVVWSILSKSSGILQSPKEYIMKNLSRGKVVGISLACALGATTLVGLLYILPYIALFRKQHNQQMGVERIQEKDMMNAVNPGDLLHEIDLHR